MSQKDHKNNMVSSESDRIKMVKSTGTRSAINKLGPTHQVSAMPSVQISSKVEHIPQMQAIEASSTINCIQENQSLHSLFENLVLGQAQALANIKTQVQSGLLSEEQAEEELLLLMLSQSMNIPKIIACRMLPSFKQSISEQEELRHGLRALWRE